MLFHVEGESAVDPRLFDFWVEMPPHGLVGPKDYLAGGPQATPAELGVAPDFDGLIYDYDAVITASLARRFDPGLEGRVIAGVMPSWDNTARRRRAAHIAYGANPLSFAKWLRGLARAPPRRLLPPGALRQRLERMGGEGGARAVAAVRPRPSRRARRAEALTRAPPDVPHRPARRHPQDRDHHGAGHPGAEPRRLAERGIVYPQIGPNAGQHSLVTAWIDLPERYRDSRPARETWRGLAAQHAPGAATVIVSSEELSRGRPGVDMRELARLVAPFGRRTVVCLLRNQLAYLQSIYLQVIRDARMARFEEFLNQSLRNNQATGVMLDYGALYDRLLEGFGADEIVFLSYEAAASAPGGVVGRLLERTGLGAAVPGLEPLAAGNSNVSPSRSPPGPRPRSPRRASPRGRPRRAGARDASPRPSGRRRAPRSSPAAEEARVVAHFAPLNAAFEAALPRRRPRLRAGAARRCPRASSTAAS